MSEKLLNGFCQVIWVPTVCSGLSRVNTAYSILVGFLYENYDYGFKNLLLCAIQKKNNNKKTKQKKNKKNSNKKQQKKTDVIRVLDKTDIQIKNIFSYFHKDICCWYPLTLVMLNKLGCHAHF